MMLAETWNAENWWKSEKSLNFSHLSIIGEHAAKVVELPPIHKDPFDRLLVAQAWVEPIILLTDDDTLGGYGDFVEVV
jgi:PIN domain nuclease of toxin-antitoxin system